MANRPRQMSVALLAVRGAIVFGLGLWVLLTGFGTGPAPRPWISYVPVGPIAVVAGLAMIGAAVWQFFRHRTAD